VRPLSSLGLMVAPPACEPGQDTFVTLLPRLDQLAPGRPLRLAVRWPGATGLTSYLSGCLSLTSQRCVLNTSPTFWKFFGPGLDPLSFPDPETLFVRLSASLVRRVSRGNRQSTPLRAGAQ